MSPPVSSSAFLHCMTPVPVCSRSRFTWSAEIVIVTTPRPSRGPRGPPIDGPFAGRFQILMGSAAARPRPAATRNQRSMLDLGSIYARSRLDPGSIYARSIRGRTVPLAGLTPVYPRSGPRNSHPRAIGTRWPPRALATAGPGHRGSRPPRTQATAGSGHCGLRAPPPQASALRPAVAASGSVSGIAPDARVSSTVSATNWEKSRMLRMASSLPGIG